jgi:DNA-binding MarR family transcriptional regulator
MRYAGALPCGAGIAATLPQNPNRTRHKSCLQGKRKLQASQRDCQMPSEASLFLGGPQISCILQPIMKEFNLENTFGYRINRCSILMRQELRSRFSAAGHDITPEKWVILSRLWEKEGLTQNELSQKTIKDKTTITRFLVEMERDGLISRKPAPQDRRNNLIHLTPAARKLKAVLIPIVVELMRDAAVSIPPQAMATTIEVLGLIERNLLNHEK